MFNEVACVEAQVSGLSLSSQSQVSGLDGGDAGGIG